MFNSIRWRIALPFIIFIILITFGAGLYLTDYVHNLYIEQTRTNLTDQVRLLNSSLSTADLSKPPPQTLTDKTVQWSQILQARITILSRDGTVVADSEEDPEEMDNHLNRPEIQAALSQGVGQAIRYSKTLKYNQLYTAVPIRKEGEISGFVRISIPESRITAAQDRLQKTIIFAAGVSALVGILLAYFIASQTTKPLINLTRNTRELASGAVDDLLVSRGDDEIGQLTRAFNGLLKTLQVQIQALQSERGKLSAVLEQMTDGVIIVDSEDRIELMNPAAENIFNTDARRTQGNPATEILRYHQWIDLLHSSQEEGKQQAQSLEIPGKKPFLQGIAIPLGEALPGHTLLLFQDLTRIRRLETTRQDFISNISHELRTPLASLKALTETLQTGALEDPQAAQKFLSRIETEVDTLAQMIAELLELSRIESGQVPLDLEVIPATSLVEEAVDRMRAQAKRRQVSITKDLPFHLPDVRVDPRRIDQVFVNLIHNAVKFSKPRQTIRVGARQEEDRVIFFVEDHGAGIPPQDLPRIFERFYKSDQARASGGTGLGLAIAKHLIETHQGEIWAESELDQGSIFYFSLPLA